MPAADSVSIPDRETAVAGERGRPTAITILPRAVGGPVLIEPSAEQAEVLAAAAERDTLMVGGPGTGKTALIVRGIWERVAAGTPLSRMVVLTHTRPAAQLLRTQIIRVLGGAEVAPAVLTPHALAHALVRRFGHYGPDDELPTLLTAPEQEFRVRELLAHTDLSGWPEELRSAARTRGFATEVRTAMAKVRQLGLDPADVERCGRRDGRSGWLVLARFFDEYLDVLDAENLIDYAELVHRARLILTDSERVDDWVRGIDQIWCDDMGEFDPSQVQLVADLAHRGARVCAATDPWTGVFGFRGADDRLALDFGDLFARPGSAQPVRLALRRNHRNALAVSTSIESTADRLPRPAGFSVSAAGVDAPRGSVEVWQTDTPGAEADQIADRLRRARLDDGLDWSEMAVITRSGHGTLALLARVLSSQGVPVQLAADEVALAEAMAVVPLLTALKTVLVPVEEWSTDAAMELLRSPLAGLHGLGLRRLARQLRLIDPVDVQTPEPVDDPATDLADLGAGEGRSPDRWVGATELSSVARCLALLTNPDGHRAWAGTPEVDAALALADLLHRARKAVLAQAPAAQVLWTLWSGTPWPQRLHREATGASEAAPRANRDLDAVCALFDVANTQLDWVGERGVRALLAEVAAQQIPADHSRESDPRQRGVTLTTAHRVKGQSWPLVVVAGVQEGVWPATRRRSTLLDSGRLTRDGLVPAEPFSSLIAAERRLFLLAISRAERHLLVTCVSGTEGEGDEPSRFIDQLGCPPTRMLGRPVRPLTLTGMVAELRRVTTDDSSSPGLRAAAATRLATLIESRTGDGRALVPGADPSRWWGMWNYTRPEAPLLSPTSPVSLSGSELESLLACPRQWFLTRQARAESGRGSASSLGSVIHVLVDHASSTGLDVASLHGHLDAVWDQIRFDAAWLSSSERGEAEAALDRYAQWDRTNRRTVVGTEISFDQTIDLGTETLRVHGTIDRLEQDQAGRLHVVDFKTGRSVPTKAEAARSAQLGLYQFAIQLGAFEDLTGSTTPGGGHLVYLRSGVASGGPKVFEQPSLADQPQLAGVESAAGHWVLDALGEAVATIRSETFEATPCARCDFCPFARSCPSRAKGPEVGR